MSADQLWNTAMVVAAALYACAQLGLYFDNKREQGWRERYRRELSDREKDGRA